MRGFGRIGLLALLVALGSAQTVFTPRVSAETIPEYCAVATKKAARALALRGAAYLRAHGPEKAFAAFQDPQGGFMKGDLYIWVMDGDGVMVANGRYPQYVGSNMGSASPNGLAARVLRTANARGRGWVDYVWYSPCTDRPEPKVAFFVKVGRYIVGAGAYPKLGV